MNINRDSAHWAWAAPFMLAWLMLPASETLGDVIYSVVADGDQELTVIKMAVTPAAEPVPALKYRLVPRDIDLKPGNSVPLYYRAFLNLTHDMERLRKKYDEEEKLGRWYGTGVDATPIADLPLEEVREANRYSESLVENFLREATARRDCDWELGVEEVRGVEIISFLLPEFQESRELCRLLALRTRLAIAEGRDDDAVKTMQMNYRLARGVASVPFLVCGLIGLAEAGVTNGTLIDLISQPNSPNLYWALVELPEPLIDLRPAARLELGWGPRMFPFIHDAETTDRSPDEWNRLYTRAFYDLSTIGGGGMPVMDDVGAGLAATGMALVGYTHAKEQLVAQGMERERVEAMAVGQVMAIYTERNYQTFADDFEKAWYLPYWEMQQQIQSVDRRLYRAGPFGGGKDREVLPIVSMLLPAIHAARGAQVRLERDVAALKVIEALRMYAASHAGGLPATLDEITEVPVPHNPATGKPFAYRIDGRAAVLNLPASEGFPGYNRRYEIIISRN